jgi:hypothetical protein
MAFNSWRSRFPARAFAPVSGSSGASRLKRILAARFAIVSRGQFGP